MWQCGELKGVTQLTGNPLTVCARFILHQVTDVVITEVAEDDDGTQTYEQYLAAKEALRVAEDAERSVRPVEIDESQFQKVKPLVREGDDEKAAAEAEAAERAAARKAAKKQRSDNIIVSVTHGSCELQSLAARAHAICNRPLSLQLLIERVRVCVFFCVTLPRSLFRTWMSSAAAAR